MSFVRSLVAPERRYSVADLDKAMDDALQGVMTATGVRLSEEGALACSAVYACVRLISQDVASLPLVVYRRLDGRGREKDPAHSLYPLLHDQPNPEMTSMEFREALQGHVLLWGNCYAEIDQDRAGRVKALWPLRPDRMKVDSWGEDGRLLYKYRLPDGTDKFFHSSRLLHVRGLSSNGITGYSPIAAARQSIALSLAAEEYGARFFGNNSRPGGVLQTKGVLSKEASERLKQGWEDAHRGLTNAQRIAILEEGVEWKQIGIPNEDAQWLESRKFQLSEVARYFGVPPHMIGDVERSSSWGTGIEQQEIGWVVHTLRPWLVRWEQRITVSLLPLADRQRWFVEHTVDGLLRGDIKTRYESYAIGRNWGWLSANDVRALENLNPLADEQGDLYLIPSNMGLAANAGQVKPVDEPYKTINEKRLEAGLEPLPGGDAIYLPATLIPAIEAETEEAAEE